MKKLLLLLAFLFYSTSGFAQQKAVTEKGDEVLLYENGTWEYAEPEALTEEENVVIPTNPTPFTKDEKSSFLLKSDRVHLGFWINPKVWKFEKAKNNEEAEYELTLKSGDLYGMIITEKIEIPLETLKNIAVMNGQAVSPDLKVVKEEFRNVNGLRVLMLQMNGTVSGIKISYYGYYYSDENGTTQFVTYTAQNLLKEYQKTCDTLLNGLVLQK